MTIDEPTGWARHGCWLVLLVAAVSALLLVVVGSFGLVGPVELVAVVGSAAVLVVGRDLLHRRRSAPAPPSRGEGS